MDLPDAPTTIGKYEIRGVLGRGAMGTVYDGWDPVIGRRVAIKTVRLLDHADPEAQEGLERFKREAQAAGRLSHPNIVGVYDYGETAETAYIVMEFVEGQSLKQHLDAGERFPVTETVSIMEQVLAGLQFSHDSGVIHRDIKPGNVMITKGGRVKLADFGIARIESSVMTQDGTMLGTPAYMSPEQLMAQTVDARSDIYSAGVVLYQLLTGERPFEGGLTAIIHKALNTVPPRPSELSVTAPASLDSVVARAMGRRPADRYPDAGSFARDLRAAFEAPDQTIAVRAPPVDADATMIAQPGFAQRSETPLAPVAQPVTVSRSASNSGGGSNKALWGGLVAIALLAAGGGAWFALQPSTPPETAASTATPAAVPAPSANLPTSSPPPSSPPASSPPVASAPMPNTPVSSQPAATPQPVPVPPPQAPAAQAAPMPTPMPQATSTPSARSSPSSVPSSSAPPPSTPPGEPKSPQVAGIVPPDPAALRQALAKLALSADCAAPRFGVGEDGATTATGLVGAGAPAAALRQAALGAIGSGRLAWLVRPVDGPYCAALDLIRPLDQPTQAAFGLALKDEASPLKDGDPIRPVLNLPDFPSHLQVDYLSHDGSVLHLFPDQAHKDKVFPPNAVVSLGDAKQGVGTVGPPFGTDLIIAIASSAPLFATRRASDADTAQTYLPALAAALDAARRNNVTLTGRALPVDTAAH